MAAGAVLLGTGCTPQAAEPTSAPSAAPATVPPTAAAPAAAAPASPVPATAAPARVATAVPAVTATAKSAPSAAPASPVPSTAITAGAPARADLMRISPSVSSRVVRTHHSGVWNGDTLSPDVLSQILDASISKLTGLNDAGSAWKALFDPGERIAIKVNTIAGSSAWTHVPLVNAVAARLQANGIPAENIFIYDRTSSELRDAGFRLNPSGPGVRCLATDNKYTAAGLVAGHAVKLSNVLLSCDALINMPLVKQHGMAGFSFAMKNHYGTFDQPSNFHYGQEIRHGLAELNALKPIKDKTRLIIGDALTLVLGNNWDNPITSDSLFMSFDPVAHDTLGLKLLSETMTAQGRNPAANLKLAGYYLASGVDVGLGTNDPAHIDFVETKLA